MDLADGNASFNWVDNLSKVLGNIKGFQGLSSKDFAKALKGVDLNDIDAITDAVLVLGSVGIWDKIKNGFRKTWDIIKPLLPAIGTWATVVAAAAIPALIGYSNTFGQLSEKAAESQTVLSATASEMESMQSTIDSNKKKLDELNATEESQKTNAAEIKNLERQNTVLEAQIALKRDLYNEQQKEATRDAVKALTTPQQYQTGINFANGELTPTYEYKNILSKTEQDIAQLESLRQKQDDLNSEIAGIRDGTIDGDEDDISEKQKELLELETEISSLTKTIDENKISITSLYGSLFDSLTGDAIEGNEGLIGWIEKLIPSLGSSGKELSAEMQAISDQYTKFVEESNIDDSIAEGLTSKFTNWLKNLSDEDQGLVQQLSDSFDTSRWSMQDWQKQFAKLKGDVVSADDLDLDIAVESEGISKVSSALEEARSATGLTAESVTALTKRYSELEGFDPEALFMNTASGIRLNYDYLARLEEGFVAMKKLDIAKEYERLGEELKLVNEEIKANGDNALKDDLKERKEQIEDEIDALDRLRAEYEGLTNEYNDWLRAQSETQSNAQHNAAIEAFQSLKQAYQNGEYGNTALQEGLEFLTGAEITGISDWNEQMTAIDSAYAKLNQTIGGTSYSLSDFMQSGQAGCNAFLKATEQLNNGWAKFDAATNSWSFSDDFNPENAAAIAKEFGTTAEFVEMMMNSLGIYGFKFASSGSGKQDNFSAIDSQIAKTQQRFEALSSEGVSVDAKMEGGFELLDEVESIVDEINNTEMEPEVKAEKLDNALELAENLYSQINQPSFMELDTSEVEQGLQEGLGLLQQYQTAKNKASAAKLVFGEGSEQAITAAQEMTSALSQLATLDTSTLSSLGLNVDVEAGDIASQIESQIPEVTVPVSTEAGTDGAITEGTINYNLGEVAEPDNPQAYGTINYNLGSVASADGTVATGVINYELGNVASPSGGSGKVSGTAHASGTARAGGNWGTAPGGKTLLGELGEEIVVDPHTGRWYTVGSHGAEFANIPKDAIVFNHLQSKSLLENGHISSRGKALASGNAFAGGGPGLSGWSGSGTGGGGGGGDDLEKVDYIEIIIDRIERIIKRIARVAESAFKNLSTKTDATFDQIDQVTKEIDLQKQGYDRYMQAANMLGLDEATAKAIQNGVINIAYYDEDTKKIIDDYKEFYEKALDCKDAIEELDETLAELYMNNFKNIQDDFDNQLKMVEHSISTYESGIDQLDAKGYGESVEYNKGIQSATIREISTLTEELFTLQEAFDTAMSSDKIEVGSSAWYEMQIAINDTKEALDDANLSLLETEKVIREIEWGRFDELQKRITDLTDEAEFLIELMSFDDLFDDSGKFTDVGKATVGLHGSNFNIFMAQADKYAEELSEINEQLAEDPYNYTLLARRDELLEKQRESILNAEKEKEAIIDLVEEGIDLELESLQELIDKYNNALDSAKDLYDYENKIKEQTSEISNLRKQLLSYQGDNSEETMSVVQKLTVKLEEAERNLEESEYDQYISDQKKLLDDLYIEYETALNSRLDNIDALIEDMIESINANAGIISETLSGISAEVGYEMTEGMKSIWDGSVENVISDYGNDFSKNLTAVNTTLTTIQERLDVMVKETEREIAERVAAEEEAARKAKEEADNAKKQSEYTSPTNPAPSGTGTYGGSGGSGSGGKTGSVNNAGLGEQHVYVTPAKQAYQESKGLSYGQTGYVDKMSNKHKTYAYASGGLADFTGLAQLDGTPQKPELVLNPQDTANFIELKDVLYQMANHKLSLPRAQYGIGNVSHNIVDTASILDSIREGGNTEVSNNFGDINVTIPIDHVQDYNDFANQLRGDKRFEKMVQDITLGATLGDNRLSKNKYRW